MAQAPFPCFRAISGFTRLRSTSYVGRCQTKPHAYLCKMRLLLPGPPLRFSAINTSFLFLLPGVPRCASRWGIKPKAKRVCGAWRDVGPSSFSALLRTTSDTFSHFFDTSDFMV